MIPGPSPHCRAAGSGTHGTGQWYALEEEGLIDLRVVIEVDRVVKIYVAGGPAEVGDQLEEGVVHADVVVERDDAVKVRIANVGVLSNRSCGPTVSPPKLV